MHYFSFMLHVSNAQNMEIYIAHVKIADSLYEKDFIHSADEYQKAIDSNEGRRCQMTDTICLFFCIGR